MPYVTLAEVVRSNKMPLPFIREALDNSAGQALDDEAMAEAFDGVVESVSTEIDSFLGSRFRVPLDPVPPLVKQAALTFLLESLYTGRGYNDEKNPHSKAANRLRTRLREIGDGHAPLTPELDTPTHSAPSGTAITAPNKSLSAHGFLAT